MSRKKKIVLYVLLAIIIAAVLAVSIWLIVVDRTSARYNLERLDVSAVPARSEVAPQEYDVQLSEITMHYAVYGEGKPLILIHGNGRSHEALDDAARYLANDYKVYSLDSRCHGGSTVTEEISYDLMAADVAEFIAALNLDKPFLMGHSDGGITALATAINYPDLLGGLIACGANTKPEAFKTYFTVGVSISYARSHSILDAMMLEEPQFTTEQLASISTPTYIVAGEFDIVKLSDTAYMANTIPNCKVSIIKWGNHSSYFSQDGKQAYVLAKRFFSTL